MCPIQEKFIQIMLINAINVNDKQNLKLNLK